MGRYLKPPLDQIPAGIQGLADYERLALPQLDAATWRHLNGGSDDELTLRDNRLAFARRRLLPRALVDLKGGSTASTLFGETHAAPILLAPVAYQRLAHPDGELATARGAAAMQTTMVVSTLASAPLEAIAEAARAAAGELGRPAAPPWFQLYLQPERALSRALVERAEAAGYRALVLTIDAAVKRSDFPLPAGVAAVNLPAQRPAATRSAGLLDPKILFGTALTDAAPTWDDLAWLRGLTRLPLLVKGILDPDDARRAVDAGADGLVVSNHGGRVLDGLPAALDALPGVVAAVDGRVPVLMDGGIRRGTDVVKALASGAAAVLLGRPLLHALALAGPLGVAHMLHLLRSELELAMAQLGRPTLGALAGAVADGPCTGSEPEQDHPAGTQAAGSGS